MSSQPASVTRAKTRSTFSRRDWLFALALLAAALIAYSRAWNGKPIWDDDEHLTKPELRSLAGLGQIWTHVGTTHQYYPLVHTVFWIEHRVWDDAYACYHLVNILLHVGSALLLAKILRELEVRGAWLAGAIFALHPLQVESVAWMSELKNVLSGIFFFSAAWCYLRFDRERDRSTYFSALVLLLLGLLCKTVIAVFPAAMLIAFWWQRGKISWRRDTVPLIPFFVLGASAGLFTAWVEHNVVGAEGAAFQLSILQRVLLAGRAFWFYIAKLFWPAKLTFIYPRWTIDSAVVWQYAFPVAALLLFVALAILARKWRGPLAAFLFFVAALFPALGFLNVFPFVYSFTADHFQYLACVGVIVLTSASLKNYVDLAPRLRHMGPVVCAVLLLTLTFLTWRQAHMYRDEETLWRTTLLRNPNSWMAHNNLATGLAKNGQFDEAIDHYEQTLTTRPDPEKGHYNLAAVLVKAGKIDKAIAHYRMAIARRPDYADAHYNLGRVLLDKGNVDGAIAEYELTLRFRPNDADAHNNLGGALMRENRVTEAIEHYQSAAALRENNADFHYNLANALAKSGALDKARAHYEKALSIRPDHLEARYELGSVLMQNGDTDRAIAAYDEVLKRNPNFVKAHINLGNLLLQKGEAAQAIEHYEKGLAIESNDAAAEINLAWLLATSTDSSLRNGAKALELARRASQTLGGKNPLALRSLAAAYAENGEYSNAADTAQAAFQLASESNNRGLMRALLNEIETYKANLPYRKK
ncbi:MAG: protein O-mannosyl-transferase [Verrucomicrobiota bacterium]